MGTVNGDGKFGMGVFGGVTGPASFGSFGKHNRSRPRFERDFEDENRFAEDEND